ncbi:CLUMA_CG002675, isoform A [Clunio marinus]|uniref:CLUMA_CG002675, isoform A n=1 Tax=Clunio marinus TaxID=568069 RepID=A0A1J1HR78_9DIPT|nr:CLUMA_CG002675, isoform A [Clunio marinus]
MEELLEEIQAIQKFLYGGYKIESDTNLDWLDQLSTQFVKLFQILQKFLMFDITTPTNRTTIIEQSFLCAQQIVVCLKFLEKTVNKEKEVGCLITSRQCFFERILWCIARLKSTIKSANDHVVTSVVEADNFVTLLDCSLDILSSFVALDGSNDNLTNKAERRAEMMMESRELRSIIERLLSHSLAFSNIALHSDKNPLTILSQNVLKIAMEFEEEFSLSQPGKKLNATDQRMKAMDLETSLCSLESFLNNSLLRLVVEVFHVMDGKTIERLKNSSNSSTVDVEIEKFDLLIDRLIQIGHFAISFSRDDLKLSSLIRSCLASIESLDSYIIPAVMSKSDPSLDILQDHFEEEVKELQHHVQQIIDTKAFCGTLQDLLNVGIETNRKVFDENSLQTLIKQTKILLDHFQVNSKNLQLTQDKVSKFYFSDFKLILTECEAILNFPEPIEDRERRILKRFCILNNTIRKLQNAIKNLSNFDVGEEEKAIEIEKNIATASQCPSKCADYFNTIRPSALGSVLYESKRSKKNPFKSSSNHTKIINSTLRRSSNKRKSLRMVIFKRNHQIEAEEAWNKDETTDLQITEILEKLTDLSTSLKKCSIK